MVGLLANSSMVMPLTGQALSMSIATHESDTIKVDREEFSASVLSPATTSVSFSSDDGQYERLLSTLGRLVPQSSGSIDTLMDMEESMFPFGTTVLLVSANSSLHAGTIERLLDLRMRGTAVHLVLTGNSNANEPIETYDFPVHYVGGKEKWHELIRTVGNDKNGAVGTSSSILRLD